jgi:hypothetical protein
LIPRFTLGESRKTCERIIEAVHPLNVLDASPQVCFSVNSDLRRIKPNVGDGGSDDSIAELFKEGIHSEHILESINRIHQQKAVRKVIGKGFCTSVR